MLILSPTTAHIRAAAAALARGGLVAFPTETVYGLGADAANPRAVARVFEVKDRPRFDPLIVHIASPGDLPRAAALDQLAPAARAALDALTAALWPGPLTLVLPRRPDLPAIVSAGLPTVAVRLPDHPVARRLIARSGVLVAAPSANRFGRLSPTRPEHVAAQLGDRVEFLIDGGPTAVGVESTVLDLTGDTPRVLRPGGCPRETIEAIIGVVEPAGGGAAGGSPGEPGGDGLPGAPLRSPGQLPGHYAPRTPLTLYPTDHAPEPRPGEGRLRFQGVDGGPDANDRSLSDHGSLSEAAAHVFDRLYELDRLGLTVIRAELVPDTGLGTAINDRLRRAARGAAPPGPPASGLLPGASQ